VSEAFTPAPPSKQSHQALPEHPPGTRTHAEDSPVISAAEASVRTPRTVGKEKRDENDIVAKIAHIDAKEISQKPGETPSSEYTSVPTGSGGLPHPIMALGSVVKNASQVADIEELEFAPNIPGHTYDNGPKEPLSGNYNSHEYDRRDNVVSSDLGGAVERADGQIEAGEAKRAMEERRASEAAIGRNAGPRRHSPAIIDDRSDIKSRWVTGEVESEQYRRRSKEMEREAHTAGNYRRDRKPNDVEDFEEVAKDIETGVRGQVSGKAIDWQRAAERRQQGGSAQGTRGMR